MDITSLRAKGVEPIRSEKAMLPGWRLRFNVAHFFRHEGGVGNIERSSNVEHTVLGVVHQCAAQHLAALDTTEACGHGYQRIEVSVHTANGPIKALAYVGMPSFIDDRSRPSQRYLNILLKGATAAALDSDYIATLREQPVLTRMPVPRFQHPPGDYPIFTAEALAEDQRYTALDDAVFDLSEARPRHEFLKGFFGGKDMTLFHLKRMDSSDGSETLSSIRTHPLTPEQRLYLDEYLHEYQREYRYVGRFVPTYNHH